LKTYKNDPVLQNKKVDGKHGFISREGEEEGEMELYIGNLITNSTPKKPQSKE